MRVWGKPAPLSLDLPIDLRVLTAEPQTAEDSGTVKLSGTTRLG